MTAEPAVAPAGPLAEKDLRKGGRAGGPGPELPSAGIRKEADRGGRGYGAALFPRGPSSETDAGGGGESSLRERAGWGRASGRAGAGPWGAAGSDGLTGQCDEG